MIQIRRGQERGGRDHGWLKTHHTFSFSDYWDPKWMGFRSLRVINEDWVAPNTGFPTHPHRDMEIITYVLEGKLEHKDSLGTGSVILPGDGQRMTAGSGIRHSEFNPSTTDAVHLLQICTARKSRVGTELRTEILCRKREARAVAADRVARCERGIGEDQSGRKAVRHAAQARRSSCARVRRRTFWLAASRARRSRTERKAAGARRWRSH